MALRSDREKNTKLNCKAAQELSSRKAREILYQCVVSTLDLTLLVQLALLLYFLRDPLYQLATRRAAEKVCDNHLLFRSFYDLNLMLDLHQT